VASDFIKNIYLFKEFNHDELKQIAHIVKSEVYNTGDEIFSQSDKANSLYVIKMGTIKLQQKGKGGENIYLTTLGSGSHFGEMSLLDNETRSTTASAVERTEILRIEYTQLKEILEGHPAISVKFYKALASFLCGRLRVTTLDLSFVREKNLKHF